jgi:hypothetical protein
MSRSNANLRTSTRSALLLAFSISLLVGCASTPQSSRSALDGDFDLESMTLAHRTVPDAKLSGPLGGRENPIRAKGVLGQRDYLARLRCKNGRAPEFERAASIGIGPYGKILDLYTLHCENGPVQQVAMDLYHCVEETRPIDGFEIVERVVPIQNFGGCPE